MSNPTIRVHDLDTNEIIDREMTDAEFKDYKEMLKIDAEELKKANEESLAKQAILNRLGLTADEAALLLK